MRGGEKALEAIAGLYPGADIHTLVCDPARISEGLRAHPIRTSWLDALPGARRIYPALMPLHPAAFRSLDLDGCNLVITNDSSLAKTVRVPPGAVHVCYCLTPPRYLWDMPEVYLESVGPLQRAGARLLFPRLRRIDREAAGRVDHFIAISEHVRERIRRHYGRESVVIYPPVEPFIPEGPPGAGGFYLVAGQLVPYKRADLAVEALKRLGRKLVVIGEGPERARLERLAGPETTFLGWQDDDTVRRHLRACRALIFPGEEDFGIVPVEAQMAGRPVIAYRKGGAVETVVDGETGVFFDSQDAEALAGAVLDLEKREAGFSETTIRRNALRFESEAFRRSFAAFMRTLPLGPPSVPHTAP
jgi:glycosyltransferase involved in cell wall biosynthesis